MLASSRVKQSEKNSRKMQIIVTLLSPPLPVIQRERRHLSVRVKQPGREADYTFRCVADIKSYAAYMRRIIKHWDSFTAISNLEVITVFIDTQ